MEQDGWKEIAEYGFDSNVKRMSVVFEEPGSGKQIMFAKGAVERIIDLCDSIGFDDHNEPMTQEHKDEVIRQMTLLADQGLVSRSFVPSLSLNPRLLTCPIACSGYRPQGCRGTPYRHSVDRYSA